MSNQKYLKMRTLYL